MSLILGLSSFVLLLLAAAVLLWWDVPARLRQRAGLSHVEDRLPSTRAAAATASSAPATVRSELPWNALLRRADLPTGWKMAIAIAGLGIILTLLAVQRIGTPWIAPLVMGLYIALTWLWLFRRIDRMKQKLLLQLPDFLDNMVRMSSVGNSLPMAFQSASVQMVAPLRPLLDTTLIYSRGGLDLDQALLKAAKPYRIETLEVLALVLGVSVRIGGRADQILQRMSAFLRDLQQAQHELSATTSETRASAWVLGLLPPVCVCFMALMSPEFFQPMFQETLGLKLLALAVAFEAVGVFLLYKLAKSI